VPKNSGNTLLTIDYRGYSQLGSNTSAGQDAEYYEDGNSSKSGGGDFTGPMAQDYLRTDIVPLHLQKADVTTCNAVVPVNIKSSVRLEDPSHSDSSQITTDSIDGTIKITGSGKAKKNSGC
jgi:hypothetical protein